jgi:hypothetical protein
MYGIISIEGLEYVSSRCEDYPIDTTSLLKYKNMLQDVKELSPRKRAGSRPRPRPLVWKESIAFSSKNKEQYNNTASDLEVFDQ